MCGIIGMYFVDSHKEINRPLFEYAQKSIQHRGPDHQGVFYNKGIALGHNRLSILDTSAQGNQPFYSENKEYVLVFNGEIFNYKLLRNQLEQKGVRFKTSSDTEVLLHLLIEKGAEAINELNGFFAFAFYNVQKHELLIARDRFGEKPLYYHYDPQENKICFGSELKAVIPFIEKPKINYYALEFLLRLTYIPAPYSIVHGIEKLKPGHLIKFSGQGFEKLNYYSLNLKTPMAFLSEADAISQLKQKFSVAVDRRMIADVPVAGFLSGGIDSSIVSSAAKKANPNFETFSLGFTENKFIDETADAEFAAKHFGIRHHSIRLNENELLENVHEILNNVDDPFGDSSFIALYSLCKKIKGKYKVVLSGDGADEVFGGYNKHMALHRAQQTGFTNFAVKNFGGVSKLFNQSRNSSFANKMRQLKKMNHALNKSWFERYWYLATFDHDHHNLLLAEFDEELNKFKTELSGLTSSQEMNAFLLMDVNLVLPNDMLYKVDMASMMNGVEIRSPFMDHELIEFAFSIDSSLKLKNKSKKYLLKQAFADVLPSQLLQKPKHGFEVPLQEWLTGPLKTEMDKYLSDDFIRDQAIFNPEKTARLRVKMNSSNPGETATTVWSILNFQYTYNKYFNA